MAEGGIFFPSPLHSVRIINDKAISNELFLLGPAPSSVTLTQLTP